MACETEILRQVPLFGLLDDEELAVLASQVDLTRFASCSATSRRPFTPISPETSPRATGVTRS